MPVGRYLCQIAGLWFELPVEGMVGTIAEETVTVTFERR